MSAIPIRGPKLRYDGPLAIATGRSRTERRWQRQDLLWSVLIQRLSAPTVTAETVDEYWSMAKPQRDGIKDVGGFVGGILRDGRRKGHAVQTRCLLALDADFPSPQFDLWAMVELQGWACVMHSTHSHRPGSPRLRLLIPLTRPVTPDEYQAVARRVAADLGINQFDKTTFEPHRLMYWPSIPTDAEYIFEVQDLPWLDPDEVLARYDDWRDPTEWPAPEREGQARERAIKRAGDPLEKPGMVGAFCRAYSIDEAISEFLADVYEPYQANRYSYTGGSTAGGLVTYDDVFAYSHHGTDPAGNGHVHNAFDLVRLHRFGELDGEAKEGTPVNRLRSYTAMTALVREDETVRALLTGEIYEEARAEFGEPLDDEDVDHSWKRKLKLSNKGTSESTRQNIITVLENDPWLKDKIALNEFTGRATLQGPVPWDRDAGGRTWEDSDDAGIRHYLEHSYGIDHAAKTHDALMVVLTRQSYHPVRDYLQGLRWDGQERVETLLVDYLGAEDNPYVRAVTRKALAAAVARVETPGCKWDYVPTLVGPQGVGKSSLIDRLAGQWFSDSLPGVKGKEAYESLQGKWIIEMGELAATRRADIESIKHFLTKREDRFRVAYGRHVQDFPRQLVFWASTNNLGFLRDATGNRRWWPVRVPGRDGLWVWQALDQKVVDQIWGEAYQIWQAGEPLYLDATLEAMALEAQIEHTEESDRVGMVQEFLDLPLPEDWGQWDVARRRDYIHGTDFGGTPRGTVLRKRVCAMEIWVELFGGRPKDLTTHFARELHEILRSSPGWKPIGIQRFGAMYGRQRAYERVGLAADGGVNGV